MKGSSANEGPSISSGIPSETRASGLDGAGVTGALDAAEVGAEFPRSEDKSDRYLTRLRANIVGEGVEKAVNPPLPPPKECECECGPFHVIRLWSVK